MVTSEIRRARGGAKALEARAKALASAVLCARTEARQFLNAGGESVAPNSKAAVSLAKFTRLPVDVVNRLAEAAALPPSELKPASARPVIDVDDPAAAADLELLAWRWAQISEHVLPLVPWLEVAGVPEVAAVLLGCSPNQAARFFTHRSDIAPAADEPLSRPSESIASRRTERAGKRPRAEWRFDVATAPVRSQLKESAQSDDSARRLCEVSSALDRVPWIAAGVIGDARQIARVAGLDEAELARLLR